MELRAPLIQEFLAKPICMSQSQPIILAAGQNAVSHARLSLGAAIWLMPNLYAFLMPSLGAQPRMLATTFRDWQSQSTIARAQDV